MISLAEIHIPDDAALGTGIFTTTFVRGALPSKDVVVSSIVNVPIFQITVSVNPKLGVSALLGTADGSDPKDKKSFQLNRTAVGKKQDELTVTFEKWRITGATLNGAAIAPAGPTRH